MVVGLLISIILLNRVIVFAYFSDPIPNATIPDSIDNDTIILRRPSSYKFDRLRQSINESVKPCENFYKFVCGNIRDSDIIDDTAEWLAGEYDYIKQMIYRKGIEAYHNFSDVYVHMLAVCDAYEKADLIEFNRQKFRKFDDFLIADPQPNITNLMLEILPHPLFYAIQVTPILGLPMLSIRIEYGFHPFGKFSGMQYFMEPIRISKNVLDKFHRAGTFVQQNDYVLTTVGIFQSIAVSANWTQYLTALLPPKILQNLADRNMTIDEMPIVANNPEMIMRYEAVIANLTQEEILGYSKTCLLTDCTWLSCRAIANKTFQLLFNRILYEEFNIDLLPIIEIADRVRLELWNEILHSCWLGEAGKNTVLRKLDAMRLEFGSPKLLLNDTLLFDFYSTLNMSKIMATDNAAEMMQMVRHWINQRRQELIVPSEAWRLGLLGGDVLAYYVPSQNRLFVGLSYFRELLYMPNRPLAFNYAVLGFAFGHEMGHGFGPRGQHISSRATFEDIWNTTAFRERVNCFAERYRDYKIDGAHIPTGDDNMDENIADHIGIRSAYGAFKKLMDENATSQPVAGLEKYTARQLFFISSAYFHCITESSSNSPHAPPEARVNVMLSQLNEFADAFDCGIGTRMNPRVKETYRYYSTSEIVHLLKKKYECSEKRLLDLFIRTVIKNGTSMLLSHFAQELGCKRTTNDQKKCSVW